MASMTVAENIWIRREPRNRFGLIDHGGMSRKTHELFAWLGIDIDPRRELGTLSIASRQMVEIAKAVSFEPDVLIMDEPTSALTDREVAHLFRIVSTLKAQGKGILYITHKMDEVFQIADEVSVFRDGRFIGTHAAADIDSDRLIHMMVGSRAHAALSQAGGRDRRGGAVGARSRTRRRVLRRHLRSSRRRDPGPGRTGGRRSHQRRRDVVRRHSGHRRRDRDRGPPRGHRLAARGDGARHGPADRGSQGTPAASCCCRCSRTCRWRCCVTATSGRASCGRARSRPRAGA